MRMISGGDSRLEIFENSLESQMWIFFSNFDSNEWYSSTSSLEMKIRSTPVNPDLKISKTIFLPSAMNKLCLYLYFFRASERINFIAFSEII